MKRIRPEMDIRCRSFYKHTITSRYTDVKVGLKKSLEKVNHVCATADLWTTRRRSFLGVTIHWYTEELERRSGCLAIRRVKGTHSYDVIGRILEQIFSEFEILYKITDVITDSGSNFVKAFSLFGLKDTSLDTDTSELENSDSESNMADSGECSEDESACVTFDGIYSKLVSARQSSGMDFTEAENFITLPPHRRCVCHTLNLVATTDDNKIEDTQFISLTQNVDKKLKTIWNGQRRSSKSQDIIEGQLNKLFIVPNATR